MGKMAVKRLTDSDLTLFEWQFRNRNAGNQKAINLNADVFIDVLYPSLHETPDGRTGRIPLDLVLFGPGRAKAWNLQRKIIKRGSYKNWRLDGEFISNPDDNPTRFNVLERDDFVVFDFEGELYPRAARAVFVARNVAEDANLHRGLEDSGIPSMQAIDMAALRLIVHASGTPESHPVYELLLDSAIEDAAHGGIEGTQRLLGRTTGRRVTRSELERARQRADDVGRAGEEFLDGYFNLELGAGNIAAYAWESAENAISPFDFYVEPTGGTRGKVEAKSTTGDFNQVMHLSLAQILEMRSSRERYEIYRVYELDEDRAKVRIAADVSDFAAHVLAQFEGLPAGVSVDGISVRPDVLPFGPERHIDLPPGGEAFPT
jgi:hypothetical protein